MTRGELLKLAALVEIVHGADEELDITVFDTLRIDRVGLWQVTSSIDACERLRERLLPGSHIVSRGPGMYTPWAATIHDGGVRFDAHASTEPRARLAAILRAYAATLENRDE